MSKKINIKFMYLTNKDEIKSIILDLRDIDILWVDTETADYKTKTPRISLIQVLAYPDNIDGSRTYLFDVLNQEELVGYFVDHIMMNESITKVFHNAKYDLRFLGGKQTKNVFCTYELAKTIPYHILPVKSKSLKTLTEYFTDFKDIDKNEQSGDWGVRPLKKNQLYYAQMDCVYLAQVYQHLLKLDKIMKENQDNISLEDLCKRYREIEEQWLFLDSEIKFLKDNIKEKMLDNNLEENNYFKLSERKTNTIKTTIQNLIRLINEKGNSIDFSINLTKNIQKSLGNSLDDLETKVETTISYSLKDIK
ncbi:3'-5' exonuclease [Cyanobacterium sp. HL-69]|uniref:3'-5' exonuclease n=1 Tax=Cyanobacterium sp. HL-69 TaxID=2054282 RepID=UPI00406BD2E0